MYAVQYLYFTAVNYIEIVSFVPWKRTRNELDDISLVIFLNYLPSLCTCKLFCDATKTSRCNRKTLYGIPYSKSAFSENGHFVVNSNDRPCWITVSPALFLSKNMASNMSLRKKKPTPLVVYNFIAMSVQGVAERGKHRPAFPFIQVWKQNVLRDCLVQSSHCFVILRNDLESREQAFEMENFQSPSWYTYGTFLTYEVASSSVIGPALTAPRRCRETGGRGWPTSGSLISAGSSFDFPSVSLTEPQGIKTK